jgi:hypothetical protein
MYSNRSPCFAVFAFSIHGRKVYKRKEEVECMPWLSFNVKKLVLYVARAH